MNRALALAVSAFAAGFGALAVLRHRSFETGRFDLGNMAQAVWSTANGDTLAVTNLAGEQTTRLASHFDPILVLFAPLWLVWPSPEALLVAQAIVLAVGALPVFWLARKHLDSERVGLGFALAYLLFPATQWVALSDFHPVALACPLLLFAFWFLDEDRLVPFAICAALACTTKEEIPLAVAGLGLWYALARRRRLAGIAIAISGAAVAVFALGVVEHFNDGGGPFAGRYDEVGGSPTGILKTLVTDPLTIVRALFDREGLAYLLALLVPLAFLPLAAPLALLPALPDLALNLLSSTETQTSIHFHYVAPLIPALFAAAIFGAARLKRPVVKPLVALVLASNFVLGAIPLWGAIPGGEDLQAGAALISDHDRTAARALRLIPGDAVVSASNSLGAHLSGRRRFFSFPIRADATWIAVDERSPGYLDRFAPGPYASAIAGLRRDRRWQLVFDEAGVLVFRRESSAVAGTP
ncbi:MAG: DUF2079 domain-containing protein [Actinobacteria bacterium]|nr:DUF2079 domain-containing protein [Actinomycetota bacterium]